MRRFFAGLLTLIALASLLLWAVSQWQATGPERALCHMMDALQKADIEKAERYTSHGIGLDDSTRQARKLYRAIYRDMRYSVSEMEVNGDRATALLTVSMVDLDTILLYASLETLSQSMEQPWWSRGNRFSSALIEHIEADGAPYESVTVSVLLTRSDGHWIVDTEDNAALLSAITGGIGPF